MVFATFQIIGALFAADRKLHPFPAPCVNPLKAQGIGRHQLKIRFVSFTLKFMFCCSFSILVVFVIFHSFRDLFASSRLSKPIPNALYGPQIGQIVA